MRLTARLPDAGSVSTIDRRGGEKSGIGESGIGGREKIGNGLSEGGSTANQTALAEPGPKPASVGRWNTFRENKKSGVNGPGS